MVSLESNVRPKKDVVFQELDGEAVILNTQTGIYYGLDSVGTRMWNLLAEHGKVETAYVMLLKEYDVTEERLRKDLLGLIQKLESKGLVEITEEQAS
nr:PqqD family protein [Desulfobacterales bacterium]